MSTTICLRVQTRNIEEGRDARRDWQQPNAALDISIGGVLCEHHGEAMACIIVQLLQSSTAAPRLAWMSEEPLAPLAPAASTPAHSMTSAAVKAVLALTEGLEQPRGLVSSSARVLRMVRRPDDASGLMHTQSWVLPASR